MADSQDLQLSLYKGSQSEIEAFPVVEGSLSVATDSGNFYYGSAEGRILLGSGVTSVSSLPLAPITNRLYLCQGKLWLYNGDWVCINQDKEFVITADTISGFPSIGNEACVYISKSENRAYRWDDTNVKYYCVGSDWRDIQMIMGGNAS